MACMHQLMHESFCVLLEMQILKHLILKTMFICIFFFVCLLKYFFLSITLYEDRSIA